MKFKQTLVSLIVAFTLSACTGSDSESPPAPMPEPIPSPEPTPEPKPEPEPTPEIFLSGKAADGYLNGANVCLDLNNNKECDTDEPATTTGDGGAFTLAVMTQAQIDANPLLVEIVAGVTIDEDAPGVVLEQAYTLSAPAGYTFVSPLTTMVQNEVDNGTDISDAETAVQGKLGTTLSLDTDYVAGKTSDNNTEEFEKLHKIAQVTANIIADNMETLKTTAETENILLDDLISLIINEVFSTLHTVTSRVEEVVADDTLTFDADIIATEINVSIATENLTEQVALNTSTAANLGDLFSDGFHWFNGWQIRSQFYLDYGMVKLNSDGSITDIEYEINEQGISQEKNNIDGIELLLTSEGWVESDYTIAGIDLNDNGSATLKRKTSALNEIVTGTTIVLDRLNVKTALLRSGDYDDDGALWASTVDEGLVFPAGASAYKLAFESKADLNYKIYYGCSAPYNPDQNDGWCSGVQIEGWSYATDLDSMIDTGIYLFYTDDGPIWAKMTDNGSVNFYQGYQLDTVLTSIGTWKDITVHGQTLRKLTIPTAIENMNLYSNYNSFSVFYTVDHDYVRRVYPDYTTLDNGEYSFNQIASQFILDNASRDNLPELFTEQVTTSDGITRSKVFTKASSFTSESAVGIYDMQFDEVGVIVVTIAADGSGTINFGTDENGEAEIGQLTWDIADGGSLDFTEIASDGEISHWSIIMVEAFDDMPAKTALIEKIKFADEINTWFDKTTVILNTFVKR